MQARPAAEALPTLLDVTVEHLMARLAAKEAGREGGGGANTGGASAAVGAGSALEAPREPERPPRPAVRAAQWSVTGNTPPAAEGRPARAGAARRAPPAAQQQQQQQQPNVGAPGAASRCVPLL